MKFLYYIAIVSVLLGCKAQYITQSNLKSGYEILDINKYDRRKKNKETDYFEKNAFVSTYSSRGGYTFMIYPNHKYYTILKKYYKNGNIKEKGLKFGGVNIGVWEYYNEDGKLVKTINEDEKFNPNFSYNDIINYLHQIGKIDKYCKKKKEKLKASFNKNEWFVRVFFETKKMGYTGRYEDKQHEYEFDYNGNILNKNENIRFIKGGHIE